MLDAVAIRVFMTTVALVVGWVAGVYAYIRRAAVCLRWPAETGRHPRRSPRGRPRWDDRIRACRVALVRPIRPESRTADPFARPSW